MAAIFGAALAADTCAVLCLILLRATVIALCATYAKKMSDKANTLSLNQHHQQHNRKHSEANADACTVAELKRQLPRARSSAERFSLFLEQVECLFPLLTHASIFLLPKDLMTHASHPHTFSFTSGKLPLTTNLKNAPKLPLSASFPDADDAIRQFVEKVLAFRSSNNLDWNNCCIFNLYKGRGPVVQSQPQWPVSCTASYHAGVVVADIISTGDYAKQGPHFLDWKVLHEKGAKSMIAVPMVSCKQVIAVLSLASNVVNAFERKGVAGLLGTALAPYAEMLKYTTRRMEMQKIVNEILDPIEPYLRHKRGLQHPHSPSTRPCQPLAGETPSHADDSSLEEGHSEHEDEGGKHKNSPVSKGEKKVKVKSMAAACGVVSRELISPIRTECDSSLSSTLSNGAKITPHEAKMVVKRREPGIGKHQALDIDLFGTQDPDLGWGDFFFNLVSMIIVYIYFSKVAVKGETLIAILLCIGVAALDVVLLLMRWLWFEQYIHYGLVLHVFQIYRVFVVPVANTWMSWRVLHNMNIQVELHVIVLLGVLLILCMVLGMQVRFLLYAPLQLVSIFFAAITIPEFCCQEALQEPPGLSCIGTVSAMQLTVGFALPAIVIQLQDRTSSLRHCASFIPHAQAKSLVSGKG